MQKITVSTMFNSEDQTRKAWRLSTRMNSIMFLADTSDKDKIFFDEKKAPTGFAYAILKGKGAGCLDK